MYVRIVGTYEGKIFQNREQRTENGRIRKILSSKKYIMSKRQEEEGRSVKQIGSLIRYNNINTLCNLV